MNSDKDEKVDRKKSGPPSHQCKNQRSGRHYYDFRENSEKEKEKEII